jgi:predicted nuclease of predicted toxin-antitoxin system
MLIADENIPVPIIEKLRFSNFDVVSIFEDYRGFSDKKIIELAKNPPKIILTEDKDFGDLVFAYNQKVVSVILLRYHFSEMELITDILINYLTTSTILPNNFIVITTKNIRIRQIL